MLQPSFLIQVFLITFGVIYAFSTLLMVGYNHLKNSFSAANMKLMVKDYLLYFFTLKPLQTRKLNPKGYDYKLYMRFQRRYILYYFALWILLFIILFLAAKIYLKAF
jgi:hypothetical protein